MFVLVDVLPATIVVGFAWLLNTCSSSDGLLIPIPTPPFASTLITSALPPLDFVTASLSTAVLTPSNCILNLSESSEARKPSFGRFVASLPK